MSQIMTRRNSDLNISVLIKNAPLSSKIDTLLLVPVKNSDADNKRVPYYQAEDVAIDFGVESDAYKKAEAYFSQINNGELDIIKVNTGMVSVPTVVDKPDKPSSVNSTPTKDGAVVNDQVQTTNVEVDGYVAGLIPNLYCGANYVLMAMPDFDKNDAEKAKEAKDNYVNSVIAVGEYVYQNQQTILVSSVDNIDDLKKIHDNLVTDLSKNNMGNTVIFVNNIKDQYPEVEAVAYAVKHVPLDWMRIHGLIDIEANEWNDAEYATIMANNGLTMTNKAGDIVVSNSKAIDGTYIDHTFDTQYIKNAIQVKLQRFLNDTDFLPYDNEGIALIKAQLTSVMNEVAAKGLLLRKNGKPVFSVTTANRDTANQVDYENRIYRGTKVTCTLATSVEKVNLTLEITK